MCSVYIYLYDCGCPIQEGDIVPCAKKGTPACHGVKEHFRRRDGYKCHTTRPESPHGIVDSGGSE
ncbi:hypothetical protein N7492_007233 [Penicillium capsulatum]|uniref:Uncharacterized protein n=1 Tax=Penicillium capsulatum TaxID=69766 RepID=A0A9W9I1X5_9EURO|nr:hypothetical protein N7492_007233 [Penicillium capsulatum]KAJ6117071.1 hypothetical protein N7512_006796 [Penicillium capsulatum]